MGMNLLMTDIWNSSSSLSPSEKAFSLYSPASSGSTEDIRNPMKVTENLVELCSTNAPVESFLNSVNSGNGLPTVVMFSTTAVLTNKL